MESKIVVVLVIGIVIGAGASYYLSYVNYTPQISELSTLFDNLNTQFENLFSEHETVKGDYESLSDDYEDISKKYESVLLEHDTLSTEYEALRMDYDVLFQDHEELKKQYSEIQSSYDELLNDYELLVGSLPLTPEPISAETIDREYEWYYKGSYWTLSLSVPESLHEYYQDKERTPTEDYSVYVTSPYDDEYINLVIQKFNFIALEKSYTEIEKINLIIAFVQSLPYTSDSVTTPFDEYPRYPLETLVDGGGDCEDTSILTAALLDALNYDVVLIAPPNHMAVGVSIDSYGSYYTYDGTDYFFLETTSEGWKIGEVPGDYEGISVYIYPLLPIPVITHNWTASIKGSRLTLEITVENVGTAIAKGIRVYAAFDAGGDYVWNPEESESFDLNMGNDVTIKLYLDVPENEHTRLLVSILDSEEYIVDESYSEWFNT